MKFLFRILGIYIVSFTGMVCSCSWSTGICYLGCHPFSSSLPSPHNQYFQLLSWAFISFLWRICLSVPTINLVMEPDCWDDVSSMLVSYSEQGYMYFIFILYAIAIWWYMKFSKIPSPAYFAGGISCFASYLFPVISLIALLRMGILEPMKASLYDKFLQLPYYEDMAPWNIGE